MFTLTLRPSDLNSLHISRWHISGWILVHKIEISAAVFKSTHLVGCLRSVVSILLRLVIHSAWPYALTPSSQYAMWLSIFRNILDIFRLASFTWLKYIRRTSLGGYQLSLLSRIVEGRCHEWVLPQSHALVLLDDYFKRVYQILSISIALKDIECWEHVIILILH